MSESRGELNDQEFNIPHRFGFSKDLEKNTNNFFNASIHCLTNIKTLSITIINSRQNLDNKNSEYKEYNELFNKIGENEEQKNQEEQEDQENIFKNKIENINNLVKNLEKNLIDNKKYQYETDNDPRKLIEFILKDIKTLLPKEMKTKIQIKCNECGKTYEPNYIHEMY